jgi:hypothetical protein
VVKGTIDDLTRRGAEIAIQFRPGTELPLKRLAEVFAEESVEVKDTHIRITFPAKRDVAEVIAQAMRVLLDANVPVLGVSRGTSLETAFLEITGEEAGD